MSGMCKVRVWAVLGVHDAGKTTVIGGLVSQIGKGPGGFREVLLRGGGYLRVYARRQSLQEAKRSPRMVVDDANRKQRHLEKKKLSVGYLNLLMAIRTDSKNGLPVAMDYLSHFVNTGWSLESLAILDYEKKKHSDYYDFGAPVLELDGSSEMAADLLQRQWLIGEVRNHFGWA